MYLKLYQPCSYHFPTVLALTTWQKHTTDGLFASCVSILKSHPMNARGCYSIGCQYTIAQKALCSVVMVYFKWSILIYIINQWTYIMHLDWIQNDSDNAAVLFQRFLFCYLLCKSLVLQPLWKTPDFKHSPPHQSACSSSQKPKLNLGLPLQLGTGERGENGVKEKQWGAGNVAKK